MSNANITLKACPLCRGTGMVHPGERPGMGTNYLNRCTFPPLAGKLGRKGVYQVSGPPRATSGLCGFPFTNRKGEQVPILPWGQYKAIVSQQEYSLKDLAIAVWDHAKAQGVLRP